MVAPGKRNLVVLVVLVGAMTLASGILLWAEPRPQGGLTPPSLNVVNRVPELRSELFNTTPAPASGRWDTITIHFSGSAYGSARALSQLHERRGLGGLAYHMVIGNGQGTADGMVEYGFRWKQQIAGMSQWMGSVGGKAVDICLVGDGTRRPPTDSQMQELVQITRELQRRLNIPPQRVILMTNQTTGLGRTFPVATFRQQLLNYPQ